VKGSMFVVVAEMADAHAAGLPAKASLKALTARSPSA
jgi:hypothetical protein